MLSPGSLAFLKRLLDTPAPSGFEGPAARVWREEAATFARVTTDVAGNSMAEVNPTGSPTIMLDGHIDEIGVIVQYIDDDGFIYIGPIGGWDPQVLVGQRIRFIGRNGDVLGVVGKKPIHLIKPADREHASKLTDLWVDIGAANRAEAEARLGARFDLRAFHDLILGEGALPLDVLEQRVEEWTAGRRSAEPSGSA